MSKLLIILFWKGFDQKFRLEPVWLRAEPIVAAVLTDVARLDRNRG